MISATTAAARTLSRVRCVLGGRSPATSTDFRRFASSGLPGPTRHADFGSIEDSDLSTFERIIGKDYVKTSDIETFNKDWMGWYKGTGKCVLLPGSTDEVSAILKHCYERRLAVVPQSGNTGLVGASIPVFDEIVLSLKRINKHFDLDPSSGVLEVDAGFILEEIDQKLAADGYMVPLDLGSKASCLIGGNVATCAGGVRLLRYGSMHSNVLGLDVVLPDASGSVLKLGAALRKDNTSIHAHHVFIGSEGQLGIVTRVRLLVAPRPTSVHSALLGLESFDKVRQLLRAAKTDLSEILSSFELLDAETMRCVKENTGLSSALSSQPPFTVLIETSGSNSDHDTAKFEAFLEKCIENGLASDGVIAESATEANYFWKLREMATLSLLKDGFIYKNDISLPLEHFYKITEVLRERLGEDVIRVICYGHVGDGNAHINITSKEYSQELYDRIYPFLYEWVANHGGSISAEHGIGRLKKPYAHLGKESTELELNTRLKHFFDPRGILNPYKFFPKV
uniref:D-2-hydroxyglutarate dehydrogenase, mitochondrial n=1 Tax=Panagrellus redivivus TaxID=6233 RepID=A0A7E4V8E2_PANRE